MNPLPVIAVLFTGLAGVVCVVSSLPFARRASLVERVAPYLGSLDPRGGHLFGDDGPPVAGARAVLAAAARDAGEWLHRWLGEFDVADRLVACGWNLAVADFRAQQVRWGVGAAVATVVAGVALAGTGRPVSAPVLGAAALVCAAGGVLWRERALDRAVAARRAAILAELPTTVDVVCLAVTAGESLRGALELVAAGPGPLASELRLALRIARAGQPLIDALTATARRVGVAPFDRFVDAVAAAQQRGIPLASALQALAADVRDAHQRDLLESAGRKQVSMLVPVVGLILPVAIVFAFYPGVVALRMVAR